MDQNLRFMAACIAGSLIGAVGHHPEEVAKQSVEMAKAINRECEQYDEQFEEAATDEAIRKSVSVQRAIKSAYEQGMRDLEAKLKAQAEQGEAPLPDHEPPQTGTPATEETPAAEAQAVA